MKTIEQDELLSQLENGNITYFREEIKKLSVFHILDLIEYNRNVGSIKESYLLIQIKRCFKND